MNGDQEPLVVFKGTGILLHHLPHTLQELVDDGGHLLRVPNQLVTSGQEVDIIRSQALPQVDRGSES